jgi:hypothetical protein
MALFLEHVDVWVAPIEDKPGGLADVLSSLRDTGANLQFVIEPRENRVNQSGSVALSAATNQGVVGSNRVRRAKIQRTYEPQARLVYVLRDSCGTFYPQHGLPRVRDTQHGARFLTIQDEIRLPEQAA